MESPARKVALYATLVLVFLKVSLLHEIIAFKIGIDTYSVLVFGAIAIAATIFSGGLQRAFGVRTASLWLLFGVWLLMAVPFSTWRGGSVDFLLVYYRTTFPLLFVIAGSLMTVRECKRMLYLLALAAAVSGVFARLFVDHSGDRLSMEFGSIKNPGDLAAHFILTLPFLAYVWMNTRNWAVRVVLAVVAVSNLNLLLSTATRGGLIAIGVGVVVLLLRGSMKQRMVVAALALGAVLFSSVLVPQTALRRYATLWGQADEDTLEAVNSSRARRALLDRAIQYTVENPILGVGPGNFIIFDAEQMKARTGRGQWQVAHNGYAEIGAEAGIPALIGYVGAIVYSFVLLNRVYKRARHDARTRTLTSAALCLMVALAMHAASIFFLSLGYAPYIPILMGLSAALYMAHARDPEYSLSQDAPAPAPRPQPPLAPRRPVQPTPPGVPKPVRSPLLRDR